MARLSPSRSNLKRLEQGWNASQASNGAVCSNRSNRSSLFLSRMCACAYVRAYA